MNFSDRFKDALENHGFRGVWCNSVHPSDNFGACMSFCLFGDGWRTFADAMRLDTSAAALSFGDALNNPHAKQRVLGFAANNWMVTVRYWRAGLQKDAPYLTEVLVDARVPSWLKKMADTSLAMDAVQAVVGSHEWLTLATKVANEIKDILDEELGNARKDV